MSRYFFVLFVFFSGWGFGYFVSLGIKVIAWVAGVIKRTGLLSSYPRYILIDIATLKGG